MQIRNEVRMTKTWPRGSGSVETGTQTHTEGTSTLCVFYTPRELPGDVEESWLSQWRGDCALPALPAWLGERCRVASRKKSFWDLLSRSSRSSVRERAELPHCILGTSGCQGPIHEGFSHLALTFGKAVFNLNSELEPMKRSSCKTFIFWR